MGQLDRCSFIVTSEGLPRRIEVVVQDHPIMAPFMPHLLEVLGRPSIQVSEVHDGTSDQEQLRTGKTRILSTISAVNPIRARMLKA